MSYHRACCCCVPPTESELLTKTFRITLSDVTFCEQCKISSPSSDKFIEIAFDGTYDFTFDTAVKTTTPCSAVPTSRPVWQLDVDLGSSGPRWTHKQYSDTTCTTETLSETFLSSFRMLLERDPSDDAPGCRIYLAQIDDATPSKLTTPFLAVAGLDVSGCPTVVFCDLARNFNGTFSNGVTEDQFGTCGSPACNDNSLSNIAWGGTLSIEML